MPVLGVLVGMITLVILVLLLGVSLRFLGKLLINAALGAMLLWLVNVLGSVIGVQIPITWLTAWVAGFLGIPGVVVMLVIQALA